MSDQNERARQATSSRDLQPQRVSVAGHIARLMSHYWTANDPPEIRRLQAEDWLEDLVEFGPDAVAEACRDWRRTQSRRPTPADIRLLAADARARNQLRLAAAPAVLSDQEADQAADEWAISHGYDGIDDFLSKSRTGLSVKLGGGKFKHYEPTARQAPPATA